MDPAFIKPERLGPDGELPAEDSLDLRDWLLLNAKTVFNPSDPNALPHPSSPEMLQLKSIGLFGLSSNPPHAGHVAMMKYFADNEQSGAGLEEIWLLPVAAHMFDYKRNQAPFEHRLKMCELSLTPQSSSKCRIRALALETIALRAANEISGKSRIGTAALLNFLRFIYGPKFAVPAEGEYEVPEHPEVEFSFLMGEDTYTDLAIKKIWSNGPYILSTTRLHVVSRGPTAGPSPTTPNASAGWTGAERVDDSDVVFHKLSTPNYSSTNIRLYLASKRDAAEAWAATLVPSGAEGTVVVDPNAYFDNYGMYPPQLAEGEGGPQDLDPAVLRYCLEQGLYANAASESATAAAGAAHLAAPSGAPGGPSAVTAATTATSSGSGSGNSSSSSGSSSTSSSSVGKSGSDAVAGGGPTSPSASPSRLWLYASFGVAGIAFLAWALRRRSSGSSGASAVDGATKNGLLFMTLPAAAKLGAEFVPNSAARTWKPQEMLRRFNSMMRSV